MRRVTVNKRSRKHPADRFAYVANPSGEGGTWEKTTGEPVWYFTLSIDGKELGGVWADEVTAMGDAERIEDDLSKVRSTITEAAKWLPEFPSPDGG
jgi:hypothetical protein